MNPGATAGATPANRDSSSASAASSARIADHTVFQVVPSWRAIPLMLACSRRIWLIAHQHTRVVISARGAATSWSCSVNTLAGHAGSAQRQVRLRQVSRTGQPKHGASTSLTSRRPWLCANTP